MSKTTNELGNLSEEEQKKYIGLVIETIISSNHTVFKLEQFKHSPAWLRETKNYGNHFLKRLMKMEKDFDMISDDNQNMEDLYNTFHDFMDEINSIDITEMKKFTNIIRAVKKDEGSMVGIAKKVMKND